MPIAATMVWHQQDSQELSPLRDEGCITPLGWEPGQVGVVAGGEGILIQVVEEGGDKISMITSGPVAATKAVDYRSNLYLWNGVEIEADLEDLEAEVFLRDTKDRLCELLLDSWLTSSKSRLWFQHTKFSG